MMDFVVLTASFTVALVLGSIIMTVLMFVLMCNDKVMPWLLKVYMKSMEKSMKNFEDELKDLGA